MSSLIDIIIELSLDVITLLSMAGRWHFESSADRMKEMKNDFDELNLLLGINTVPFSRIVENISEFSKVSGSIFKGHFCS